MKKHKEPPVTRALEEDQTSRSRLLACVGARGDAPHIVWLQTNRIRGRGASSRPEHPGTSRNRTGTTGSKPTGTRKERKNEEKNEEKNEGKDLERR